jgi:class 3 adenylate cyclase
MRLGSTALATERVERRLAAILAADVAGYSRLMGVDEEGTLARLKALRRELRRIPYRQDAGNYHFGASRPDALSDRREASKVFWT